MLNRILEKQFVNLKSNLALKSNKSHNFLGGVSLQIKSNKICRKGCTQYHTHKQAILSSQEDKQSIEFKAGAIKCYKVQRKKLLPRLMSGVTFHADT